jgi:hypothetical protein
MKTDIEIKVGEELDKAVADAAGIECKISHEFGIPLCHLTRAGSKSLEGIGRDWKVYDAGYPFTPSRDLNAAIAAAESVFEQWVIERRAAFVDDTVRYAFSGYANRRHYAFFKDTFTLAICAAILEVKDQNDDSPN